VKLYKVLDSNQRSCNGGFAQWIPGQWMPPIIGKLIPCENGYHLCHAEDLVDWLDAEIWEAEYRGEIVEGANKAVVREARITHKLETWNERSARLFACDCAEQALKLVENPSIRSTEAVRIARLYADGKATHTELSTARRAVWIEEEATAGGVAWATAGIVAWAAAWSAAKDAVGTAVGTEAKNAMREKQTRLLLQHLGI